MNKLWMVGRVMLGLLVVGCGIGPGILLMALFGANARTVTVGVALVAGAVLLAGGVDAVMREMAKVPGAAEGSYARRMTVVRFVAGALLAGAVVVFLVLIGMAVARSIK